MFRVALLLSAVAAASGVVLNEICTDPLASNYQAGAQPEGTTCDGRAAPPFAHRGKDCWGWGASPFGAARWHGSVRLWLVLCRAMLVSAVLERRHRLASLRPSLCAVTARVCSLCGKDAPRVRLARPLCIWACGRTTAVHSGASGVAVHALRRRPSAPHTLSVWPCGAQPVRTTMPTRRAASTLTSAARTRWLTTTCRGSPSTGPRRASTAAAMTRMRPTTTPW
eukprot:3963375-Prymnesium_polylepis.1